MLLHFSRNMDCCNSFVYETTNLTGTVGTRNGNDPAYRRRICLILLQGFGYINAGNFWIRL